MNSITFRRVGASLIALVLAWAFAVAPVAEAYAQGPAGTALMAGQGGEGLAAQSSLQVADATVSYGGVGVSKQAKALGGDWSSWVKTMTIGSVKGKGLTAVKFKLTGLNGISGSIAYQAYRHGAGWSDEKADGAATKSAKKVEAVKIKLSGTVSEHYDVLYRSYVSGKGWQSWVKNGSSTGLAGKNVSVTALQVRLSPKTMEGVGKTERHVGVFYALSKKSGGWQIWRRNGQRAGVKGSNTPMNGLALKLDAGKLSGSVSYSVFTTSAVWEDWKSDGARCGKKSQQLEGVKIKLSGAISKKYDIYYRAYVKSYGWLDWAKNGQVAGSTFLATNMNGLQVKLVEKGTAAPGNTKFRTVNLLEKSKTLNGIDIASYQDGINLYKVPADFVIVKATQGDWYTNPCFKKHADATLDSGKLLGTYHYADLQGSPIAQADYYVKTVKPYLGKCILVLDWEAEALTLGPKWAKKFLDRVYKKTGVRPLIYLSQSVTKEYNWSAVAKNYKLWVAQYLYRYMNHRGYLKNPAGGTDLGYWSSAIMYQYSSTTHLSSYNSDLDADKFYGSAAIWRQLT